MREALSGWCDCQTRVVFRSLHLNVPVRTVRRRDQSPKVSCSARCRYLFEQVALRLSCATLASLGLPDACCGSRGIEPLGTQAPLREAAVQIDRGRELCLGATIDANGRPDREPRTLRSKGSSKPAAGARRLCVDLGARNASSSGRPNLSTQVVPKVPIRVNPSTRRPQGIPLGSLPVALHDGRPLSRHSARTRSPYV